MQTILCLFRVKVNMPNSFTEPHPGQICDAGTGRLLMCDKEVIEV